MEKNAENNTEHEEIYTEFKKAVNMTASVLKKWLKTDESKKVGWDSGDGESIGHKSGEHIIRILGKKKAELSDADYKHMQKVNGYIARHVAQKPKDPKNSNWDYSLKNWGHDYLK
ncbi:DUF3140 domain-containing protein [Mucilaginibacter phyllosphaerae]|uniref:DUF3140 domain-containing protein n=1 Tax=Mucilaginibacter phyllosphaerae TaxID=1812349 RepID=A0A4Y8AI43_9SPHI|nr:DUF3140 domain-containing protein [Mucilaginibacter phyllosphaerae]MBB3968244.1 hypothetical protein [Mucilaginibacter phyllosphaerae]TEW68748.1 DUF3140 domain-containing protein [Mucilaginibacter phyllosphaerae]GGH00256.1 DNA-binding protein [Mucilaginibacter phyllosphaerae]